jgi:hypothetical protein
LIIIYTVFGEDLRAKFIDKFGDSYQHFWSRTFGRLTHLVVGLTVGIVLFTLPTGYLRNIQLFGHPIESPTALKHQSVERAGTLKNLIKQGSRNVVRYSIDMVNLDGLRNIEQFETVNQLMRKPIEKVEKNFIFVSRKKQTLLSILFRIM